MTSRRTWYGACSRRAPLVAWLVAVTVLGGCSARGTVPPVRTPCATTTGLLPTAATPLVRMSEALPGAQAPFSVSLVATGSVPVRIGTEMGFQLSSGTAGYASLYLVDPLYAVQILAENLPIPAGSLEYPSSQGFTLRAAEPVGLNQVILLVTRQPFSGFSGNETTLTAPVTTALDGVRFVSQLNNATARLPAASWAADDICVRIAG